MPARIFRIALLLSFLAAPAAAESPLTLPAAIAAALLGNAELGAVRAAASETSAARDEARGRRGPKVEQYDQYSTSDDALLQLPDSNQVVVRGDVPVIDGPRESEIRRLEFAARAAEADVVQKEMDVALEVRRAFAGAQAAENRAEAWAQAQTEFDDLLKFIAPKFTVGSVPEYDYAAIRSNIVQYRQNRLDAVAERARQLRRLGVLMGASAPKALAPLPAVAAPSDLADGDTAEPHLENRPDLRSAALTADAAKAEDAGARRERWPVVRASADAGLAGPTFQDMSRSWDLGATATLPLFDWGSTGARIRQASARRDARTRSLDAARATADADFRDRVDAVWTAWEKLRLTDDLVTEGRRAYQSSLHRYRSGLAPMTELNEAHDLSVQARVRQIDATLEYRLAEAELRAARGPEPEAP